MLFAFLNRELSLNNFRILTTNYPSIKSQLFEKCIHITQDRIANACSTMENAQKAANEEGKSSAGDKYETTRAMMQIERDNAAKQLDEALKLHQSLLQIDIHKLPNNAQAGSLVITTNASYFIAVSLGQITVDGTPYFVISPMSPMGQQLLSKKQGQSFQFNGDNINIDKLI